MRMYMYLYMYICVCIYAYVYAFKICIRICICVCICICIWLYMYMYQHMYLHVSVAVYIQITKKWSPYLNDNLSQQTGVLPSRHRPSVVWISGSISVEGSMTTGAPPALEQVYLDRAHRPPSENSKWKPLSKPFLPQSTLIIFLNAKIGSIKHRGN